MAFLFRQKPVGSRGHDMTPCSPGDKDNYTYPLHFMDQAKGFRFLFSWTMCSEHVLDASMLEASLSRLLEIGDWRKLAARLHLNKDGSLTAHVPRTFTKEQPAILFHHTSHSDLDVADHDFKDVFLRPLPRRAFVHEFDQAVRDALLPAHFPKTFDDMVAGKHPQLSLHVISFRDGTIVNLTFPHTMLDGPSFEALLLNWCLVLAGRESEVAPVLGARDDVVCDLLPASHEPSVVGSARWGLAEKIQALCRFLWRRLTQPRPNSRRMIYMPGPVYQHLLAATRAGLASGLSPGAEGIRLSSADILLAWCSKVVASASPRPRPLLAVTIVNPRYRVPCLSQKLAGGVYIQNMSIPTYIQQSAASLRNSPVDAIALLNREQLQRQTTEQQMLAFLSHVREQSTASGKLKIPICGDPASTILAFNNIAPMKFLTVVDFSPAIVPDGEKGEAAAAPRAGTLVSCSCFFLHQRPHIASFTSVGEDRDGGFWIQAVLDSAQWKAVENGLRALEQECGM